MQDLLRIPHLAKHQMGGPDYSTAEPCELHRTYFSGIDRGVRNVSLVNIERVAKELKRRLKITTHIATSRFLVAIAPTERFRQLSGVQIHERFTEDAGCRSSCGLSLPSCC
jgi:hypothetical protein